MSRSYELNTHRDEQFVTAALGGDNESFASLVNIYWPIAVALSATRIEDFSDAEDVAQNSFVKAYQNLHKLKERSRFGGWFSRIVIQECNSYFRRQNRIKPIPIGESLQDIPAPVATNPGLTAAQKQFVRSAVARLAEKYRIVVVMRFIGGLNSSQIAAQLGERSNTVRVRLHRAYRMLRENLAPIVKEVEIS
ncbi:MAG: RNA polymerase sigma factor [Gammaproteobacteria bacterium]|nr:RNA polymerase sigma factor [Gammaproteobacteria bacterium]